MANPVAASPTTAAAGTRTGLNMRNSTVATARPTMVAAKMRPERRRRVPPVGRSVMSAIIWEFERPPRSWYCDWISSSWYGGRLSMSAMGDDGGLEF